MRTLSRKTTRFFATTRSRFRDATACSWVLRNRSIDRRLCICVCAWKWERRVSCEEGSVFSKNVKKARFSRFRIYVVVQALGFMSASVLLPYTTSLLRKTNRVGEDSCCRGGIVRIRGNRCSVRLIRRTRSTALWRFRVSTSNSPSDP